MTISTSAILSPDRQYRYTLWRLWDRSKPALMVIGLNPSTADEDTNDPTIRRCINFAKSWNFGGLCMVNLFAYRATAPEQMMNAIIDPVGERTDELILKSVDQVGMILAAWGGKGGYQGRDKALMEILPEDKPLWCLGKTKDGHPRHPLYIKGTTMPVVFP